MPSAARRNRLVQTGTQRLDTRVHDSRPIREREEVADDEYFAYSSPEDFRPEHLKETLQISAVGDSAVLLLNPQVIDEHGEWEAWFFANWLPGVRRFRSFAELMDSQYHGFINAEWKQPVGVIGKLPNEYTGAPGNPKRLVRKRRRPAKIKVLDKPIDRWDFDELLQLFTHEEWTIRQEVAEALGKLKDPRAIEPLFALVDDNSNASVSAIYALKALAPDRLRERLLDLLRTRHFHAFPAAASLLAEMQETRAIPILVEMLTDHSQQGEHGWLIARATLGQFGAAGFDALVSLLEGQDALARSRAAQALMYSKDSRVVEIYRALLSDADPAIRDTASVGLKVLNAPRTRG